jgi:hypothetical protein
MHIKLNHGDSQNWHGVTGFHISQSLSLLVSKSPPLPFFLLALLFSYPPVNTVFQIAYPAGIWIIFNIFSDTNKTTY